MTVVVVKPLAITAAMLTSTDVPENDYAEWNSGTTYAKDARVIIASMHKVYQSLQASNTNKDPTNALNSTWWIEVGPTNRWKLFDTSNSTQTTKATSLSYRITPGVAINCVALLNCIATTVRIQVVDPVRGTVYDKTTSLAGTIPAPNWYDYFFSTPTPLDQVIALDVPPCVNAYVQIDMTGTTCSVGVLMMGYQNPLGVNNVKWGARAGMLDYSRKDTNTWGDTILTQRAYSKKREWAMEVPNAMIDEVERQLIAVRATACLWVGYQDYAVTTVFGFYRDWDITISYPDFSDCTLTIEGMT
jgi:hypothetical protein